MRRIAPIAVTFAALAALVAWKEFRAGSGDVAGGRLYALAAEGFAADRAERIEVTAPGGSAPAYVLAKKDGAWLVAEPFPAPAHGGNVQKLLSLLADGDGELRSDDAALLSEFDLTPDRATEVKVTGAGGQVLARVAVGETSGMQGAFVRLLHEGDSKLALATTKDIRGALGLRRTTTSDRTPQTPAPGHFHNKDFPQIDVSAAVKLECVAPGRSVTFEKGEKGWAPADGSGPAGHEVNADGLSQITRSLGPSLGVRGLADPRDLAKLGLAEPRWSLAFTMSDGSTRRFFGALDASNPADARGYLRLDTKLEPDVVYELTQWEWNKVFPTGGGLFRMQTVPVKEEEFLSAEIEHGGQRIAFSRAGTDPKTDWTLGEPKWPLRARQGELRSIASLLRNIRPVDWIDGADLGPVAGTVRLRGADAAAAPSVVIEIGGKGPSGKDRLARLPGSGRIWLLADSTVDRLLKAPLDVHEPEFLAGLESGDVTGVRVERRGADGWAADFALAKEGADWHLVRGDARTKLDAAKTVAWLEKASAARATGIASGDEPAEIRVTFDAPESAGGPRTVELTAAKDGKRAAVWAAARFDADGALVPDPDALAAAQ
ncbi:MAG: hypothetical protein HMLKMBBP_00241 [Planctomycetes bacterium]|nr:hypothetical protein [Planctomycetota bacterium]